MKQQEAWPSKSDTPHFTGLPFTRKESDHRRRHHHHHSSSKSNTSGSTRKSTSSSSKTHVSNNLKHQQYDYSLLPFELVQKIAASFSLPNLRAASLVCHAWRDALQPLRQAMMFLRWGKRYKHGRGGLRSNVDKALEYFLEGAARGSTPSMVDAGLIYWEMGKKEKGIALYTKAAELGDPNGQCNLGISYLQADPPSYKEAVEWLYKASFAGHVRAQYQLALCLHQGRGLDQNLQEAARWYQQAAQGGYVRAMYNTSLCYSFGEGLAQCRRLARKWMKRAADRGHSKAQLEYGLLLFSVGRGHDEGCGVPGACEASW
ncbi:F-box protein At1g70590 isoform X2 [Coffea arabica]|uniref:F-box protein At1g70590 isoform X2 n=1 Tax=Coffea arabica TaxID=13443 RepID=A0ABM4WAB8_COFAR